MSSSIADDPIAVTEVGEFFTLVQDTSETLVFLIEHETMRTGELKMTMGFSDGASFQIVVPAGYPEGRNLQFAVKSLGGSSKIAEFSQHMHKFAVSNRGQIRLNALLFECVSTYAQLQNTSSSPLKLEAGVASCSTSGMGSRTSSATSMRDISPQQRDGDAMDGDWSDNEEDAYDDDESCFTTDFEIRADMLRKKWKIKEEQLRAKWAKESGDGDDFEQEEQKRKFMRRMGVEGFTDTEKAFKVKEGENIFQHSSAAFQILSTELIDFMRNGQELGFEVSPIDENVYSWRVRMNKFDADTVVAQQLVAVKERFGYDYIELQMEFMPAYPFFPPSLRVVRPRFEGTIVQALANIDILKLTYWNPATSMRELLIKIRQICHAKASVRVEAERNDATAYPEGAYLPLDAHLIKLAQISEVRPRGNYDVIDVDNLTLAPTIRRITEVDHKEMINRAKGGKTGPPKAKTAKTTETTAPKATGWAKGTGYGTSGQRSEWNPAAYVQAQKEKDRQVLIVLKDVLHEMADDRVRQSTDLYSIIESSALVPFVEQELKQDSFVELSRHHDRVMLVLDVVNVLAEHFLLLPLLCNLAHQRVPVVHLLEQLASSARQLLEQLDRAAAYKLEHDGDEPVIDEEHSHVLGGMHMILGQYAAAKAGKPSAKGKTIKKSGGEDFRHKMKWFLSKQHLPPASSSSSSSSTFKSSSVDTTDDILSMIECQKMMLDKLNETTTSLLQSIPPSSSSPSSNAQAPSTSNVAPNNIQSAYSSLNKLNKKLSEHIKKYQSSSGHPSAPPQAISAYMKKMEEKRTAKLAVEEVKLDEDGKEVDTDRDLAMRLVKVYTTVTMALVDADLTYKAEVITEDASSSEGQTSDDATAVVHKEYIRSLKSLQFRTGVDTIDCAAHFFGKNANSGYAAKAVKAIFREHTALRSSLPLTVASSIFVVTDENKMNVLTSLITGPEDTPYANGCFVFDVLFPATYPVKPPSVNSRTNGGGAVRFNPNLYNCGKVCLSLLGTWAGDSGEQWNAQTSTLLQVLVSIQSLILVDEPYYNEPGYERTRGQGRNAQSDSYNATVRSNCMKWAILEQMKNPPRPFADVVNKHFTLKAQAVLNQCGKWAATDGGVCAKLLPAVKKELERLVGHELTAELGATIAQTSSTSTATITSKKSKKAKLAILLLQDSDEEMESDTTDEVVDDMEAAISASLAHHSKAKPKSS